MSVRLLCRFSVTQKVVRDVDARLMTSSHSSNALSWEIFGHGLSRYWSYASPTGLHVDIFQFFYVNVCKSVCIGSSKAISTFS